MALRKVFTTCPRVIIIEVVSSDLVFSLNNIYIYQYIIIGIILMKNLNRYFYHIIFID